MVLRSTYIPQAVRQVDNDTIKVNGSGEIYAANVVNYDDIGQIEIQIIELAAETTSTPYNHDSVVAETFSDATGYGNLVNGNTTAIFDTNKFKRAPPELYYKLEDASEEGGGTALTLVSSPPFESGRLNNAVHFDGAADYAHVSHSFSFTTKLTINFWLNGDDTPGANETPCMLHKIATGYDDRLWCIRQSDRKIYFNSSLGGVSKFSLVSTTVTTNGTWYMVTLVLDGTDAKLYINGSEEDSAACSDTYLNVIDKLYIGLEQGGSEFFDGLIDDFSIFSTDQSTAWITARYNTGTGSEVGSGTQIIEIDLPTITGTITHSQLILNDPERETGDDITYDILDSDSTTDTSQAADTKNELTNPDGTKITGGKIKINLVAKSSSPTSGYPSVKSFALKLWKA